MNEHVADDGSQPGHPSTWRPKDTATADTLLGNSLMRDQLQLHLAEAHQDAAAWNTQNGSSAALTHAATLGLDYHQCVAQAIHTLGMLHGPVKQARAMLWVPIDPLAYHRGGLAIPGYGNSFYRGGLDDAVKELDGFLRAHYTPAIERLDATTQRVREVSGAELYPNLAAYTALVAQLLEVPVGLELHAVITARMEVWRNQWQQAQPARNVPR